MPDIKCSVSECHYNEGMRCNAPMIQVERDNTASASTSSHTRCETFKKKS
ncbi:DUF1540 domain-containing protein [Ammonifex thiophilus]|uniref:DUF1540 domain-containing protein n=1 Tax=Ammonifex thiophilus TaxID=444093 RepID=A0A3D8P4Z4_9THEO|nr:DUF1540 domain-containing protein [Ammonifex thiophilus]RDV82545.1 DUF1540 domain-containing protein [Ammonifex thiophilus]